RTLRMESRPPGGAIPPVAARADRPGSRRQRPREVVQFLLCPLLHVAVPLLEFAGELVAAAGDRREVVVRELAPLLLHLPLDLVPVALDLIPVHGQPPEEQPASRGRVRAPSNGGGG